MQLYQYIGVYKSTLYTATCISNDVGDLSWRLIVLSYDFVLLLLEPVYYGEMISVLNISNNKLTQSNVSTPNAIHLIYLGWLVSL